MTTPANLWAVQTNLNGDFTRACLIISQHDHGGVKCAVTACGLHYLLEYKRTHWWLIPAGEVPLAEAKLIHCGLSFLAGDPTAEPQPKPYAGQEDIALPP